MIREPLVETITTDKAVPTGTAVDLDIVNVAGYSNITLHLVEDGGNSGSCKFTLFGAFTDSEPADIASMHAVEEYDGTAVEVATFNAGEKIVVLPNIAAKWLGIKVTETTNAGAQDGQVTVELTATAENG